jgi:hypothetical protein
MRRTTHRRAAPRATATAEDHAGDALVAPLKPAHAGDADLVPCARDLARGERALGHVQELLERELRVGGRKEVLVLGSVEMSRREEKKGKGE